MAIDYIERLNRLESKLDAILLHLQSKTKPVRGARPVAKALLDLSPAKQAARDRLVKLRDAQRLEQTELARMVGVSRTMVWRWEALTSEPGSTSRAPYAKALGITVAELMGIFGEANS